MRSKYLAGTLIAVSLILLLAMIVGSFVTYAPTVSANEIQNRCLARIFWYGGASSLFQAAALVVVVVSRTRD